ncbi:MAG TPA: hypothetical protein DIW64_11955 [Cellvibrio sp.]|nr:hypothetical protein [Cellvibrio sp.]
MKSNIPDRFARAIIAHINEAEDTAITEILMASLVRKNIVMHGINTINERTSRKVLIGCKKLKPATKNMQEIIKYITPQIINPLAIIFPT